MRNCSNENDSNEIRIRRRSPVLFTGEKSIKNLPVSQHTTSGPSMFGTKRTLNDTQMLYNLCNKKKRSHFQQSAVFGNFWQSGACANPVDFFEDWDQTQDTPEGTEAENTEDTKTPPPEIGRVTQNEIKQSYCNTRHEYSLQYLIEMREFFNDPGNLWSRGFHHRHNPFHNLCPETEEEGKAKSRKEMKSEENNNESGDPRSE